MDNHTERRTNRLSIKELLAHAVIKLCGTPANNLTKWVPITILFISIAPYLSSAIVAYAGKNTRADIRVDAKAKVDINRGGTVPDESPAKEEDDHCIYFLYLAMFGGAVGYGGFFQASRQHKLREDVIQEKTARIQELERMIDPNRSSAKLNGRGGTDKEFL